MPINWQDKDVADRLLAAIIASHDNKINCTEVARLYGKDATYNAIENFLRKPKKVAAQLKAEAEAEGRQGPAPSPVKRGSGSPAKKAAASPGKKIAAAGAGGLKTGRVEKKTTASPRKKKGTKVEEVQESVEFDEVGEGYDNGHVEEEEEEEEEDLEEYV